MHMQANFDLKTTMARRRALKLAKESVGECGGAFLVAVVQSGARRHGIVGIRGNPGIVESVTYRIQWT
jgi:hypothetical protein